MYEYDSFFTLSWFGRIGLLLVSGILAFGVCGLAAWGARIAKTWRALFVGLAVFWGFIWLSPQVYYQYYRMIIADLPQQWVIKMPPSAYELLTILTFQGSANLATHTAALLGWGLLALATYIGFRRSAAN